MRFGGNRRGGGFGGGRRFGGPSRFERDSEPKPIKVGEEYDVEIKETGSKGDGIARISNFVVFVNGAKLGEKVRIKITEVRDRFAIGEKVGGASETEETKEEAPETSESVEEGEEESPEQETEETKEEQ